MQTSRPTARAVRWSVPSKSRCTRSEEAPRGALTQSQLGLERSVGASEEKRGDEEGKGRRGRRHELGKSLALEGGQRKAGRLEQLSQQQRGGQRGGRRVRSAGPGDPAKVCVIIPPKKATSSFETSFPQLGGAGRREQRSRGGGGVEETPRLPPPRPRPAAGLEDMRGETPPSLVGPGQTHLTRGSQSPHRQGPCPRLPVPAGLIVTPLLRAERPAGGGKGQLRPRARVPCVASWPNTSFSEFLGTSLFANANRGRLSTAQ